MQAPSLTDDALPVFVTGGSGFVGRAVINRLVSSGRSVRALVRSNLLDDRGGSVQSFQGDLSDLALLEKAMAGCGAVIHLVGIIAENLSQGVTFARVHVQGTRAVVQASESAGIRRYIHMSAQGTRENAVSEYHRTKWQAEEIVSKSTLDWTIFRPSLIHGQGGEFIQMATAWVKRQSPPYLFMPYFGAGLLGLGGAGKLQPVHVGDVARAFVDALSNDSSIRKLYPLGGADVVTWPALYRLISESVIGKRRAVIPIPAWYAKTLTTILPASMLPFNECQVIMSQEDNTTDISEFVQDFSWTPAGFAETVMRSGN